MKTLRSGRDANADGIESKLRACKMCLHRICVRLQMRDLRCANIRIHRGERA